MLSCPFLILFNTCDVDGCPCNRVKESSVKGEECVSANGKGCKRYHLAQFLKAIKK
jgi:hypothetical protein